jgi:Heterokaryon incompatibility protein (HET)
MNLEQRRCTGCQDLVKRLFDPEPLDKGTYIDIHTTFVELVQCGKTKCDLCQFIAREFYYQSHIGVRYFYPTEALDICSDEVKIALFNNNDGGRTLSCQLGHRAGSHFTTQPPFRPGRSWEVWQKYESPESLIALSRDWLNDCLLRHKTCGPHFQGADAFLPTRLVGVGSQNEPFLRLVLSTDLPPTRKTSYTTLSYCWGQGQHSASTTEANYAQRLQVIPTNALPKTFSDAITITRGLGISYIWIDALCIIQPTEHDQQDWEREFQIMGRIYAASICTIAASGAENNHVGCFARREPARWPVRVCKLFNENAPVGKDNPIILEPRLPEWNVAVENSPLSKRGWVLQERMMASRTLFWTKDALFWECSELCASEYEPKIYTLRHVHLSRLRDVALCMSSPADHDKCRRKTDWVDIIQAFSQKALSQSSDKLPALAGVANELATLTGMKYEDGVWCSNLVQELAWAPDFRPQWVGPTSTLYLADSPPLARLSGSSSWSWASLNARLSFRPAYSVSCQDAVQVEDLIRAGAQNDGPYRSTPLLRVRGNLGMLNVRKTKKPKLLTNPGKHQPPTPCTFEPDEEYRDATNHRVRFSIILFDTQSDVPATEIVTVTCLKWIKWEYDLAPGGKNIWITGAMIIVPTGHGLREYGRIGWADLAAFDDDFFDRSEIIDLV